MRKYYIGHSINGYVAVCISEDGYEDTVFVKEENLDGFIQCLTHFGFV